MPTKTIADLLTDRKATLATAESCTGGLIANTLTNIPGASTWFSGSIVAYANDIKERLLGVSSSALINHGAVSAPVAIAMANGVRKSFKTTYALSTTGIAGPGGATPDKPVGLVFIACSSPRGTLVKKCFFTGSRGSIRKQTMTAALLLLTDVLK